MMGSKFSTFDFVNEVVVMEIAKSTVVTCELGVADDRRHLSCKLNVFGQLYANRRVTNGVVSTAIVFTTSV